MKKHYVFLEHTADLKIRAEGKSLQNLFENCAQAIIGYMSEKPVRQKILKKISLSSEDYNSLLYLLIEEIIYLIEADNFLTSKARIRIEGKNLEAELSGDKASDYEIDGIKAPTYAEMKIEKNKSGYSAEFVVDI